MKVVNYIALLGTIAFTALVLKAAPRRDADTLKLAVPTSVEKVAQADSLLAYAHQYMGIKYRRGGKTPKGFDCSGFVKYVFAKFGYDTPASSSDIKSVGVEVSKDSARVGDIIYFTGRKHKSKKPGHVGIITEIKDGNIYFIHASVNKGISVTHNNTKYYKVRYLGIRRVLE